MTIRILITGGTIDKEYDKLSGKLEFTKSSIPQLLQQARCDVPITLEIVMLKDSLEMVDADRMEITKRCIDSSEEEIIITHGTDTMVETGKILAQRVKDKIVVLVGAMVPYAFGGSDALFNLASAITAVQLLPYGIYVTMNGKTFRWNNVRKNKKIGRFEELSS